MAKSSEDGRSRIANGRDQKFATANLSFGGSKISRRIRLTPNVECRQQRSMLAAAIVTQVCRPAFPRRRHKGYDKSGAAILSGTNSIPSSAVSCICATGFCNDYHHRGTI